MFTSAEEIAQILQEAHDELIFKKPFPVPPLSYNNNNNNIEINSAKRKCDTPVENECMIETKKKKTSRSRSKASPHESQLKKCNKLLHDLKTSKCHLAYSQIFLYPVDPISQGCPDYYHYIKNPMDLSTIQQKMNDGIYKKPDEFAADIRLMLQNCFYYNPPNDPVYNAGLKFQSVFESRYDAIVNPPEKKKETKSELKGGVKILRPVPQKEYNDEKKIDLPDDEEELRKRIYKAEQLLEKYQNQLKKIMKQKGTYPRAKKLKGNPKENKEINIKTETLSDDDDDDALPMSYDEKRNLTIEINKLTGKNLQQICYLVKKHEPISSIIASDDEVEIDFEVLKTKTMRILEQFVNSILHPKPKRKAPIIRNGKLIDKKTTVKKVKENLDIEKKNLEMKLASVENKLGMKKKAKTPPPQKQLSSSSSSSSSSDSDSSSSGDSSSDSDSD